jgi:hypothetical protein
MPLEITYSELKKKFVNLDFEDYSVVKSVDDHRHYWKPEKVETLLLAESHVFTSKPEHETIMNYSNFHRLENCPDNYVRLVYCLGYGESILARVNKNPGTPQFWKIFASCVNKDFQYEQDKILKTGTPNFKQRLENKIALLEKLKQNGIWLLDASVIALYKDSFKPSEDIMQNIIQTCWKHYISETIQDIQPQKIIVIGKGVSKSLSNELKATGIPIFVQPQPNARLSSNEIKKMFERYYELCINTGTDPSNVEKHLSSTPKSYFHPSPKNT